MAQACKVAWTTAGSVPYNRLLAQVNFEPKALISRYGGELITAKEAENRNPIHLISLNANSLMLDASAVTTESTDLASFANDGRDYTYEVENNCRFKLCWNARTASYEMWLQALRHIYPGEEILVYKEGVY